MNNRIWKYVLEITDQQTLSLPVGAKILSVHNQNNNICLWVMVDMFSQEYEDRIIEMFGTGPGFYIDEKERTYIGTVVLEKYVWHIFELNLR
jgi:hypothetical protein